MLKKHLIIFVAICIITGCYPKKESYANQEVTEEANGFFPVTQYILGQLNDLDSLQLAPLRIAIKNGKTDSTWMKKNETRAFTRPFVTPVIDSIHWHKYFSEKSFFDQTTNAYTFSYDPVTTLPDSVELRRWDIYVDPVNNKVKRIFIVKQVNNNAGPQTIQLTWKTGYFCKITTITETASSKPKIEEEQLIWNFNE